MKIGFIGAGNMGFAFMKGILSSGVAGCEDVFVFDKNLARQREVCEKLGVEPLFSASELAESCGMALVAVKPHQLDGVLTEIAESVKKTAPLIVSFAAGKTLAHIGSFLDAEARIIRLMPNLNVEFSMGMCAYCRNKNVTEYDVVELDKCLMMLGRKAELDESLFDAYTAVAGCAPAFVYMFTDALANAALKLGMSKKTALETAAQTLLGSAATILSSNAHPRELADKVCSPGGATIAGVAELIEHGFENAVMKAVFASYNKAKTL